MIRRNLNHGGDRMHQRRLAISMLDGGVLLAGYYGWMHKDDISTDYEPYNLSHYQDGSYIADGLKITCSGDAMDNPNAKDGRFIKDNAHPDAYGSYQICA